MEYYKVISDFILEDDDFFTGYLGPMGSCHTLTSEIEELQIKKNPIGFIWKTSE